MWPDPLGCLGFLALFRCERCTVNRIGHIGTVHGDVHLILFIGFLVDSSTQQALDGGGLHKYDRNMATPSTEHPSPRWLIWSAWTAFLCTIPSAIWRALMILGLLPGGDALRGHYLAAGDFGYVMGLSIVQLFFGFLAVGLIRPWGEHLAGYRVPPALGLVLGVCGGLIVTYLFDWGLLPRLLAGGRPDQGLMGTGIHYWVMAAAYSPIFFWGPLTIISSVGYWLRRTGRLQTSIVVKGCWHVPQHK